MTPDDRRAVLAAAEKAARTGLASIVAREDCAKILRLQRDDEGARLLSSLGDREYALILAEARGPARGPLTPPGEVVDLDAMPRKLGA